MSARSPLRLFGFRQGDSIKPKIASTIREIELHRRELENLRSKLDQRRRSLFETTVRAMMSKDKSKASVYANEWSELRKVGKVVYASELALTQVVLRLESIRDVGDVMMHMSSAFKILKKVNQSVQGLVPAIDQASDEISNALTETMTEMGNVSPTINLNINTESGAELVEEARRLAEQRANEMKRTLGVAPQSMEREVAKVGQRVPMLTEGASEDEEEAVIGTLFRPQPRAEPGEAEERVLQYANIHNGRLDVTDASTVLKMPSDEVEQAMLTLMAQGKVKVGDNGGADK